MAGVQYKVYGNDHAGGPVDLTAPLVSALAGPPWPIPAGALVSDSDSRFRVVAYDPDTGEEDDSGAAEARLVIGTAGEDRTFAPVTPRFVTARPAGPGLVFVAWEHDSRLTGLFAIRSVADPGPIDPLAVADYLVPTRARNPGDPTANADYGFLLEFPGSGLILIGVSAVSFAVEGLESGISVSVPVELAASAPDPPLLADAEITPTR